MFQLPLPTLSDRRFGNMGSLSVKEISSAENPPVKTSKSPGLANVLDINNSTLMFVGGLGGQIKVIFAECLSRTHWPVGLLVVLKYVLHKPKVSAFLCSHFGRVRRAVLGLPG